jgi:serine phosphatase RsbU (regulator of sigma subunit)
VQHLPLEAGDRLMFYTDGIIERNTNDVDVEAMLTASAQMHARQAVQHLIQAILRATKGTLDDDATALCLDWHGGPVRARTTDSGANE